MSDPRIAPEIGTRAWALCVRGLDVEAIADQLGVPRADLSVYIARRAARRSPSADTLRLLKQTLFSSLGNADVRDKPRYATAIAMIESKLVQLEGALRSSAR